MGTRAATRIAKMALFGDLVWDGGGRVEKWHLLEKRLADEVDAQLLDGADGVNFDKDLDDV